VDVLKALHSSLTIAKLCFEQDCEPCWKARDENVTNWCEDNDVDWVERVGHTLWNPHEVGLITKSRN